MTTLVKSPKDFWTGLIYLIVGGTVLWIVRDYGIGTASRMGPGYFPAVLSSLLVLFGILAIGRSFLIPGEPVGALAWKPLALVLGAIALFAALINTAGLILALVALILVSASASEKFQFDVRAALGLVVLVAFCSIVFVKGLGIPMPLIGPWLEPFLGSWLV